VHFPTFSAKGASASPPERGTVQGNARFHAVTPRAQGQRHCGSKRMKGILLWAIGIPIPIIILLYLFVFR